MIDDNTYASSSSFDSQLDRVSSIVSLFLLLPRRYRREKIARERHDVTILFADTHIEQQMNAAATARSILSVLPQVHLLRKSELRAQQRISFSRFLLFFILHLCTSPCHHRMYRETRSFFFCLSSPRSCLNIDEVYSFLSTSLSLSLSHARTHARPYITVWWWMSLGFVSLH